MGLRLEPWSHCSANASGLQRRRPSLGDERLRVDALAARELAEEVRVVALDDFWAVAHLIGNLQGIPARLDQEAREAVAQRVRRRLDRSRRRARRVEDAPAPV